MPPEGNRRGKQCSECLSTDHYKRDCPNIIATRERSGHSAPTPAAVRVQHQHQPGLQQSIVSCSTVGFAAAERGLIRGRLGCSIALPKSLRFGPGFSWLQLYSTGDCTRKTIRRDGDNLVLCENCHGIVLGAGAFPYYDNSFPYRDIILERPEDFDLYEVQLQELLRASRPAPPPGPQQLAGRRERRSRSRSRDRRWRSPSREQRGTTMGTAVAVSGNSLCSSSLRRVHLWSVGLYSTFRRSSGRSELSPASTCRCRAGMSGAGCTAAAMQQRRSDTTAVVQ